VRRDELYFFFSRLFFLSLRFSAFVRSGRSRGGEGGGAGVRDGWRSANYSPDSRVICASLRCTVWEFGGFISSFAHGRWVGHLRDELCLELILANCSSGVVRQFEVSNFFRCPTTFNLSTAKREKTASGLGGIFLVKSA
jgi:hypothetical protein